MAAMMTKSIWTILVLVLALMVPATSQSQPLCPCLKCALWTHMNFWMPTGSMNPNLPIGSCFVARKFDQRDPLPEPGQIVVFKHSVTGEAYVKRLVAIGGQTVEMRDGRLILDDQPVGLTRIDDLSQPYQQSRLGHFPRCRNNPAFGEICVASQFIETLANGASYHIRDVGPGHADNFGPVTVPDGTFFVLGDNRDDSADSRFAQRSGGPGFIAKDDLHWLFEDFIMRAPPCLNC